MEWCCLVRWCSELGCNLSRSFPTPELHDLDDSEDHVTTVNHNNEFKICIFFPNHEYFKGKLVWKYPCMKSHSNSCFSFESNLGIWRDTIWSSILVRVWATNMNRSTNGWNWRRPEQSSRHIFTGFVLRWLFPLPWGISTSHYREDTPSPGLTKIFYAGYVET